MRVQDLREMARRWGWPLRGTAKADLTAQLADYLGDPARMAAGFTRLPALQQQVFIWADVVEGMAGYERLQEALRVAEGQTATVDEIKAALQELFIRGLLFPQATGGWSMPFVHVEWLPETAAPGLADEGVVQALPVANMEDVSREVERLLDKVEKDRPHVSSALSPDGGPGQILPQSNAVGPRYGVLGRGVWTQWGYGTGEDADRARFLLELMVSYGLCRVVDTPNGHLVPWPSPLAAWQDMSPPEQRLALANAWVMNYQKISSVGGQPLNFTELDMALRGAAHVSLRSRAGVGGARCWISPKPKPRLAVERPQCAQMGQVVRLPPFLRTGIRGAARIAALALCRAGLGMAARRRSAAHARDGLRDVDADLWEPAGSLVCRAGPLVRPGTDCDRAGPAGGVSATQQPALARYRRPAG